MRLVLADRVHTLAAGAGADSAAAGGRGAAGAPDALLLRDGRVVAVGPSDELAAAVTGAALLDLRGTTITPGLTDSHIHLLEWALSRREVDLADCRSPEECARAVAKALNGRAGEGESGRAGGRPPADERPGDLHIPHGPGAVAPPLPLSHSGPWLRGRGWNPHRWGGTYPDRSALDALAPDRPVVLQSHDMHALWVNARALAEAGIDRDTPDLEGGVIVRDETGEPTGVLLENAGQLLARRVPPPSVDEAEAVLLDAQGALHRLGITGVHSFPGVHLHEPDTFWLLQRLAERDALRLRVLQHISLDRLDEAIRLGLRSGFGGEWIRIGAVKLFLDGALGSRTALLREPYESDPAHLGVELMTAGELRAVVARAAAAGIAAAVHAIGDAAVARALDVLADPELRVAGLPHRVEHVQLAPAERIADFGRAGVVCSMQPAHLLTDWAAADRHWGGRSSTAFAFGSLLAFGAVLAFGSDGPVEPVDPRLGFRAATVRRDLEGNPAAGWHPSERLDMLQVLRAYALGPAIASGARPDGTLLGPGAPADFVAWSADPLARGQDPLELRCLAAVVAGEVVWRDGP